MQNRPSQGNSGDETWCLARKDAVLRSSKYIKVHAGSSLQAQGEDYAELLE